MNEAATSIIEPVMADPYKILGTYERIMLYGPGGTGKTFTAGTAPEPQWWLTPGGTNELKTIFSPKFIKKHGRREIFVTSVREDREGGQMTDNPNGYDRCCLAVDGFLERDQRDGLGVKTIVVDNATILEEYMMNKAIMAEYHMSGDKEKAVLTRERNYGIRKPHDSTYGGAQSFMARWANWLIELPYHLVFIAHDYEISEQKPGKRTQEIISVRPDFVGKQRTSIPRLFDNVWYTMTMGGGRSQTWGIQPEKDEIRFAKTRVGGILDPSYERDPDLAVIIQQFSDYADTLKKEQDES